MRKLLGILVGTLTIMCAALGNYDFNTRFGPDSHIYNTPLYFGCGMPSDKPCNKNCPRMKRTLCPKECKKVSKRRKKTRCKAPSCQQRSPSQSY